ncbi:hypothetical protein O181_067436 [Austropuccinia psidii MF-1]|uniref:Uncharacterized protein n=1 Tax=Austropuccinia psidii MF-1 TaxID=1389203 RepID=A0A9Q3EZL9_9BASI|nr:hypothetical protein [Austropuccinia psidii MF-1]
MQGKPTLTTCTGKITIINPVVTSKGKLPKSSRKQTCTRHSQRNLRFQRNQPGDRERVFRIRRPGGGHLGHSGGWKETEGNHTHPAMHFQIQQEPQTRGLEGYGSSSSAPPTPQRFISMEHRQQEVQPVIQLGRTWSKLPEYLSQRDTHQRRYGSHQRLESHQAVKTAGGEGKQNKGE